MLRRFQFAAPLVGLLLASGCGSGDGPTGTVVGSVVNKNQPVPSAVVTLYDPQLIPAGTASVSSDGQFQFENPVPFGTYTATLMPASDIPAGDEDPQLAQATAMIPQRFRDPSISPFKVVVDEEEESFELLME